jgi:peptidoglycan/LPS O-acetylase OafA/YrhL
MSNILSINIKKDRVFGLDILRCLAILFVVIGHGNYLLPKKITDIIDYFILDGVSIFFVLSGFLIGGILIKEIEKNDISFKLLLNFWKRRWFRTLPNYFLILIILCFLNVMFDDDFDGLRSISRYFIFSQNLFSPHPSFFPEAWSLSIEEWFYLLTPLTILLISGTLKLSKKSTLIATVSIIILAVTIFRFYRFLNVASNDLGNWDFIFRKQVFTRLDSLMFGVIGAYLSYYNKSIWLKYKNILFFIGTVLLVFPKFIPFSNFNTIYFCVFSFSITAIATLFLIPYLSEIKKTTNNFLHKIVTYISLISYSMYLINLSIIKIWILDNIRIEYINVNFVIIIKYFLYWFLTVTLSILIYKYFEIPTTEMRDTKILLKGSSLKRRTIMERLFLFK